MSCIVVIGTTFQEKDPIRLLLFKVLLSLLALTLIGGPVYLLLAAIQSQPLVQAADSMQQSDVARIKDLLRQHDPRGRRDGEIRRLAVTERDLNLILDYSLRDASGQRGAIELSPGTAPLKYSG